MAGSDVNDCAVPEGSLQIYEMSVYLFKSESVEVFFCVCECVTVDQRCLDRETLIYDIWHRLFRNYSQKVPLTCGHRKRLASCDESLLLILTDVGCE